MGMALEGGEGGELDAGVGVSGAKRIGEGRVRRFRRCPRWRRVFQDGRHRSRISLRGRMDNLRRDEGGELAMSRFDRFSACMCDLGEEEKMRIHRLSLLSTSIAEIHFHFGRLNTTVR